MSYSLPDTARAYADSVQQELVALTTELCTIPAPSNDEKLRASLCLHWLLES